MSVWESDDFFKSRSWRWDDELRIVINSSLSEVKITLVNLNALLEMNFCRGDDDISVKYAMKAKVVGCDYCITGGNYVFLFRFVVSKKLKYFVFYQLQMSRRESITHVFRYITLISFMCHLITCYYLIYCLWDLFNTVSLNLYYSVCYFKYRNYEIWSRGTILLYIY